MPSQSHRMMRATLDGLPAHLCVLDARGTILFVNRAWKAFAVENGADPAFEPVGSNYLEICDAATGTEAGEAASFADLLRQVLDGRREGFEVEYACHSPTELRWFVAGASRVQGSEPPLVVVSHQPITARKFAEARLREAQRLESLGTLASGIAHDFNNALGAILGNAELASDALPPGHTARESVERIRHAALRARDLVARVLAFSRSEPIDVSPQSLGPLVDEAVMLLRSSQPAGTALNIRACDRPLWVLGNATELHQVIVNLCTNAWNALRRGPGSVTVALAEVELGAGDAARIGSLAAGPYARLSVIDTGVGMDAAVRARIFEPFFTTQRVGEGTGLGLSIVLGAVRRCGGAIDVVTAPGRGSAFHVFLPLCGPGAGVPAHAPAPAERRALVPAGARILVLDDDDVVGITVEALLSQAGYTVRRLNGATAALDELANPANDFGALVTDYIMPERSGLDVCRAAAALRPGLLMVLMSGHLDDEVRARAARLGVCGLVRKEYVVDELVGLLQGRAGTLSPPMGFDPAA